MDEAGLAGTQDIAKLSQIAKDKNARIILSGDKQQHKSVARGAPFRLLESQAGIKPHEVTKIRRQSGYFRYRITNATSEGFNSRIQSIKSAARGFRDFQNYRTRILFYCGKLNLKPDLSH